MLGFLPSITIHSAIADPGCWNIKNDKGQVKGHDAIKLWYFLRAADYQGNGSLTIDLRIAAIALKRSLYTIRRWLKSGLKLGFFRGSGRVGAKTYRIFYTSAEKICLRYNLADLGACTDIEVCDLNNIKFLATEATTKQLQQQSAFQAKGKKKKNLAKCIPSAELLTTSDLCTGAILHKVGRFTFLKFYAHPHGASQETITDKQNRHISTIGRRLSDGYRAKHGLPPIPKTQILAAPLKDISHDVNGNPISKFATCLPPSHDPNYKGNPARGGKPGKPIKIWKTSLGYFRLCPNVYDISHELGSKRRLRSNIKRSLKDYEFKKWCAEEDISQNEYKRWLNGAPLQECRDREQALISSLYET
jgi:hypothetical protein